MIRPLQPATALALGLALAACLPQAKFEAGATRLPKSTQAPTPLEPAATREPLSSALTAPPPGMEVGWPPPYTYGNPTPPPTPIPPPAGQYPFDPEVINILLLGSDARSPAGSFRTDVLILVSIHSGRRTAAMISIPRDLYVYLPGYSMQRINTAFQLGESLGYPGGGPGMLADTVRYNLGLPVHHFIRVEMDGFRRIIDALGGVDVNVACYYRDWRLRDPGLNPNVVANWHLFTVPRGVVHMDGDYALWYARARQRSSDFDRSRRQHEVLRAAYREALHLNLITELPALYDQLRASFSTDMGLSDLLSLTPLTVRIDLAKVQSRFIGRDQVSSWRVPTTGAQVLLPRADAIQALLQSALEGEAPNLLVPDQPLTVEVVNASGQEGWSSLAAERLNYAGYAAHPAALSGEPGAATHLVDFGLAPPGEAERLLQALGLATPRLVQLPDPSSPFTFRLVLGTDYNPCFDPTRNQG